MSKPAIMLQDVEAERRVLGICLKDAQLIAEARPYLQPDYFTYPQHRWIWEIICETYDRKGRCSFTNVYTAMRKDGVAEPNDVLIPLTQTFISRIELMPSIEAIQAAYERRKKADDAKRLWLVATEEPDIEEVRKQFSQAATSWAVTYQEHEGTTNDVLVQVFTEYEHAKEGKPVKRGITTGLVAFDERIGYLEYGSLLVLGGRPHMGKTATILNLAAGIAQRHGWVLFHSLEMPRIQAVRRLVQAKARVTAAELESAGNVAEHPERVQARIEAAFNQLYQLRIEWCDKRGLTAAELCARARKAKRDHPDLAAWFIDYLQLIHIPESRSRSHTLQVGDVCRMIRDCAGELSIPVILVSQLNRDVERRDRKEPTMSDLRDSGNIEEFADYIVLIYRPAYYAKEDEAQEDPELRLIVAKNRVTGRTGTVVLELDNSHQYIRSADERHRKYEYLNTTAEGLRSWW